MGILIGAYLNLSHLIIIILLIVLIIISAFYLKSYNNNSVSFILLSSVLILFGVFRAGLDHYVLPYNSVAYVPDTPEKQEYFISGIISDIPDYDSTRVRFNIEAEELITKNGPIPIKGEVITTIFQSKYNVRTPPPKLKAGDRVELSGRLVTPWGKRNPGEFDYRNYLLTQDIHKSLLIFGYENAKVISQGNLGFLDQRFIFPAKYFATQTIENNMSGDEAEYLKGLVTGQRNDISTETKDAFIKTGVMHLIAVSGLNVAYLIIITVTVLSIFRVYFRWKTALVIAALIFYCLFTGSSPSIVRATIMGILLLLAYDTERKVNFYNIVGFSAFVILIFNTKQLFDPGFILSYTAVLSMVFCYEKFRPYLVEWYDGSGKWYRRWMKYALILFVTTLAAQIGVLPVTGNYFEKVSIVSLPANLIIVPLANLSLAIGFMQVISAIFSTFLSSVIADANTLILSFQLWIIKVFSTWDFAYFEVFRFDGVLIAAYFLVLLLLLTMNRRNFKFRISVVLVILFAVIILSFNSTDELKITFLDTGAGECTVIQTPEGKTILVNCGIKTETYDSGERTIVPFLKRNGVENIDLIIITGTGNNDTGLKSIQSSFPVSKILNHSSINEGDYIDSFKDIRIYFLAEGLVKISYKDLDLIYADNINAEDEKYIENKYGEFLESDIAAGENFSPKLFKPQLIVTSSLRNSKKFNELISSLDNCVIVKSTNREGAIVIRSSGHDIRIIDWN